MLIAAITLMPATAPAQGPSVLDLTPAHFSKRFYPDLQSFYVYSSGLIKTLEALEADESLFDAERKDEFDPDEKSKLYSLWGSFAEYIIALDNINSYYGKFYLLKDFESHQKAFYLAYASYIAKLALSIQLMEKTNGNELYETKLDGRNPLFGMPAGMYARLKGNALHVKEAATVAAGYAYMKFLETTLDGRRLKNSPTTAGLFVMTERHYAYLLEKLQLQDMQYFGGNALGILRDRAFAAWFPVRVRFSIWMADTGAVTKDSHLADKSRAKEISSRLLPGDIMVQRENWHLSNAGLPGFWPHAALYVGSYGQMLEFFSNEKVTAHYRSLGKYSGFMDYLKHKYPKKMNRFMAPAPDGLPVSVIEAVGDGVVMNSILQSARSDYAGAVRPRLSRLARAQAVDEAFRFLGRPYDFNFDFLTDYTLVCSELIYKVYLPAKGKAGLNLLLRPLSGRKSMPPNDIVRKFDQEFGAPGQELDFVYFFEADEKNKEAASRTVDEFRKTHRRPKWDIVQK